MFKFFMIKLLFKNGWLARNDKDSCFFAKEQGRVAEMLSCQWAPYIGPAPAAPGSVRVGVLHPSIDGYQPMESLPAGYSIKVRCRFARVNASVSGPTRPTSMSSMITA